MQTIQMEVSKAFGMPTAPQGLTVMGLASPMPETPQKNPSYKHRREIVRDVRSFFISGETTLMIFGYTGCGKSTTVEQYHAATNLPLLSVTANPDMMKSDLIGKYVMTASGMEWRDGPILKAARNGWSIMIDEYNLLDPAVGVGLNSWLEGRGEFIEEIDEMVRPQPGFRMFITSNPADVSKGNLGRNTQDASNDDRGWFLWVNYPKPEEEIVLVEGVLQSVQDDSIRNLMATNMVGVANKIRLCYTSDKGEQKLGVTMSTRTLLRWATMTMMYANGNGQISPVHYALERSLTFRPSIEQHEREAIHEMVHQVFGEPYKPSAEF
jgi:cobaltochelatase CobS